MTALRLLKPIVEFKPAGNLRCRDCMKQVRQDEYKRRGGKKYIYEHKTRTGISF